MFRGAGLRSAVAVVLALASGGYAFAQTAPAAKAATKAAAAPSFGHAAIVQRGGEPTLVVDGKPFFFFGGAFFYERLPASRWRSAMLQMSWLGANTLDLYVPWNWHELADGEFDFDGHSNPRRNLREVIRLGKELGFWFIVRPGPVIRNEWRNGGYPAWLLQRPEYGMPPHDVLEGRYPATATLQNAHADDAAAEWMANRTHLRYSARWLHAALREFTPVADRVLAVQLDDDQAAYSDNQTYPAPHLSAYLGWLEARAREVVGPVTPTFINTYDMRVPAALTQWTMGNWYQSDAFQIGEHDRAELDFTSATLRTNRRGPFAQSEFQAGWLAAPEDPQPRAADPSNTALALHELLAWGAHGIIDFPMHDTLAPFGWEAPFSNAFYGWDAALRYDAPRRTNVDGHETSWNRGAASDRYDETAVFGSDVARYGPLLAEARRWAVTAIAYPASAYPGDPSSGSAAIARFRASLSSCVASGGACEAVDLRFASLAQLRRYRELIVNDAASAATARSLLRAYRAAGGKLVDAPTMTGLPGTLLVGEDGSFLVASNWSPLEVRYAARTIVADGRRLAIPALSLQPRTAQLVLIDVRLRRVDAHFGPDDRITTACRFFLEGAGLQLRPFACELRARIAHQAIAVGPSRDEYTIDRSGHVTHKFVFDSDNRVGYMTMAPAIVDIGPTAAVALAGVRIGTPPGTAVAYRADVFEDGASDVVLQNAKAQVVMVPDGGARVPVFRTMNVIEPLPFQAKIGENLFDATGGLRDDVLVQPPLSVTDRIGKWTRSYPAGMFNRPYTAEISDAAGRAEARMRYCAPDVVPNGACFERVVSLAPDETRLVVDENITVAPGPGAERQRLVVLSSLTTYPKLTALAPDAALPETPADIVAPRGIARALVHEHFGTYVTTVSWAPGAVESARWEPHTSDATLRLVFAPGRHRVTYALAKVDDAAAARAFVEAERAWVAANPAPVR